MSDIPLVRLLSMAVTVALDELHDGLSQAGHPALRPVHGYALNAILGGATTAATLAPRLGMTKQGAAKVLQALLAEGYVLEGAPGSDGRAKPVELTNRGRDAIATSVRLQGEIEQHWAGVVGVRRMATLRHALQDAVRARTGEDEPVFRASR